ncbi:MAG: GNAT family N-acetyltransferase [Pseudomonadota bacterium]
MKRSLASIARKSMHQVARAVLAALPRSVRFSLFRNLIDCDEHPDERLELKIADTQEELEACFRILHDAYVAAGFMKPDPSGLRVTIYHALPTTTTLCAKWDGQVVGTISMIREGVFGFPLQSVFNLGQVRSKTGKIAEISALAIDPRFRATGGRILFPLMKFMYEYCREYFDTRHIVIAVNPNKIEMYESLLFFERLQARVIDNYDFANGAPAVGATLDLLHAPEMFRAAYNHKRPRKNLFRYFVETKLANIRAPNRRFFTTNDPVLTPAMMDHFFNRRTAVFQSLNDRQRLLLRSIYDHPDYRAVLPAPSAGADELLTLRQHQRFSIRCPARLSVRSYDTRLAYPLQVIELSLHGFQAECGLPLPEGTRGWVEIDLGENETALAEATAVRRHEAGGQVFYGFSVPQPDDAWKRCVVALQTGSTHADLDAVQAPVPAPRQAPGSAPRPRAAALAVPD